MRSIESKRRPAGASEQGFTLIETSIAMMIMMVAGLAVAGLFTYSIRYNTGGTERAVAISIAQQQIEQLRVVDFNDSSLTVSSSTVLSPDIASNGRTYRVIRTVTGSNNDNGGNPTLKTITIQVAPMGGGFPVTLRSVRTSTTKGAN